MEERDRHGAGDVRRSVRVSQGLAIRGSIKEHRLTIGIDAERRATFIAGFLIDAERRATLGARCSHDSTLGQNNPQLRCSTLGNRNS